MFTRPDYQWVERRQPLLWLVNLWRQLMDWIDSLSRQHPLSFKVLLWGLVLLLVALLAHVAYVVWRIVRPSVRTAAARGAGGAAVVLDARSHLARAEELARAGRYAEALGHRFLAVVLELEEANALRFHASKTPAEYVGEVRLDDSGRATFATLVARLYRHLFAALPCDEAEYREFGATAEQLRRHVVPA
ncbi:MAG TPA: DUF4129 domain-containing protein [Gemmatimonadales bacterium]|nr:DUF4129 domain-containing protein [Gemmatimonadales bacterium]